MSEIKKAAARMFMKDLDSVAKNLVKDNRGLLKALVPERMGQYEEGFISLTELFDSIKEIIAP